MSGNYSYIYDELLKLDINLSYDDIPSPKYLQEKIIQCNRYMAKVEHFSIEINRALTTAERTYKIEKLDLEVLRRNTLTNDIVIRKIPTGKEREAAVDEKLENNHRELVKLENAVNDLKGIQSSIKLKYATLKLSNTDIKQLMKLMDQQINRLNIGHPDDSDMKDLSNTYKEIDELEKEIENSTKDKKPNLDEQLNVVESSVTISQSNSGSSAELVKPAERVETDLQVVVEDADQSGEPVKEDESDYDPNIKVAQESDSHFNQEKGIGESPASETQSSVGDDISQCSPSANNMCCKRIDTRQDTDDFDEGLASFLTEDVTNELEPEEDVDRDDLGEISTEDPLEGASVAASEDSERVPDIDIDDSTSEPNDLDEEFDNDDYQTKKVADLDLDITGIDLGETGISENENDIPVSNLVIDIGETGLSEIPEDKSEISVSNVTSRELELPKMDIDLSDIGIDIGVSGMSDDTPEIKESSSITKSTNKTNPPIKGKGDKKETQVSNEKSEKKSKENSEFDFDLEDILNSFD